MWDAHKDMALATGGALIAVTIAAVVARRRDGRRRTALEAAHAPGPAHALAELARLQAANPVTRPE